MSTESKPEMRPFGFAVERTDTERYYWKTDPKLPEPRFRVWLPHSCDKWEIVGDSDSGRAEHFATQAEAVAELERFVTEAQEALAALRVGDTYGDDSRQYVWED